MQVALNNQSLSEIREDQASGETARIYEEIRHTFNVPIVNFVWRHIATLDNALAWCWPRVRDAADSIRRTASVVPSLCDEMLQKNAVTLPSSITLPTAAVDVLESYNRGNSLNYTAMTLLAAACEGREVVWGVERSVAAGRQLNVPPYPKLQDLSPQAISDIAELSHAGPAAGSGVRPSLWVHLGLWPDVLAELRPGVVDALRSAPFHEAWSEMLRKADELLSLPPGELVETAGRTANPLDIAIRRFRLRIAEMLLIGRAIAIAAKASK